MPVDAATDAAASASDAGAPAPGGGGSNGPTGSGGAVGSGGAGGQGGFGGGLTLPVTVTTHYFPSGWFGDAETMAAFGDPSRVPIKLKPSASDGPCAARVSGAAGQCMKVTYTPIMRDDGMVGYAGIALLGMGTPAQRVAQGATVISAQVAGAVGGELVDFTFGHAAADGFMGRVSSTLTTTWQEVKFSLAGVPYDRISNPFTWGTDSATPITFYYDNVQIK